MIVVDTSVWVEFLKHRQAYFLPFTTLLDQQQVIAVECVFGELLQGAKTSREQSTSWDIGITFPSRQTTGCWFRPGYFLRTIPGCQKVLV